MILKIHHTGYLTNNVLNSIEEFKLLGYDAENIVIDTIQRCKICLMYHTKNKDCIELVEPLDDNVQMLKMLKKRGNSPYHVCYEVDDINEVYNFFCQKEGWMNIFKPVKAIALNNRLITYFYNNNIGFVEFVNTF